MKLYIFFIALMFIGLSCNKNEYAVVDKDPVENADPTAITQGIGVPAEYIAAHNEVVQAIYAFDATLTPEKVQSYNGDFDRAIADMNVFISQRISLPSADAATLPNARGGVSPDPSTVVNTWVDNTSSKLDVIDGLIESERITDEQGKNMTEVIMAVAYNQMGANASIIGGDRNSLLGSHYSANGLMAPAESVLSKLVPNSAHGRLGFFKKLRRAVIKFVKVFVVATVKSFAKGCFQGVSTSGSINSCIPAGIARASSDLNSNLQDGLKKAAGN